MVHSESMPVDRLTAEMAASLERLRKISNDREADLEGRRNSASSPEAEDPAKKEALDRRNEVLDRRAEAADRRDESQTQREALLDDRQAALDRRAQLLAGEDGDN